MLRPRWTRAERFHANRQEKGFLGMRYSLMVGALVVCLAALAGNASATTDTKDIENLDRYVGRDLVKDNRAARAAVVPLLPLSCPPFYLKDENGAIIDPTVEEDVNRPVSLKQTCDGLACHDVGQIERGYHFQAGADEMYHAPGRGEPALRDKGPGFFGKWQLLYQRELAPQLFTDPDQIDMTSFDWVLSCGICHPGGGPGEFDRSGRRYDRVLGEDTGMAQTYNGDYYQAEWHKTGVLEADCLICHLGGYEYSLRAQQIKQRNFKWAATVAAGFATIEGTVADGELPRLSYHKEMFGPDGKVHLPIQRPADRNCMFCHHISGVQKRGTTWHDNYMQDMHSQQGLACIDCHKGDIRHQIAKGHSTSQSVRNDIDGGILSCKECHESQEMGAPNYTHPGIPPIHFKRMSCESCHITHRPLLTARTVDTLVGRTVELPNRVDAAYGQNRMFGAFWNKVDYADLEAIPTALSGAELRAAAALRITPDDADIWNAFLERGALPAHVEEMRAKTPATVGQIVGDTVDTDFKRKLTLLALRKVAQDPQLEMTCVFRGIVYRLYGDRMQETESVKNPPRIGYIAEYPVAYAYHERDGEQILYPEGYQLGVYWAYDDGHTLRPIFLRDMKAAWEYLSGDVWHFVRIPARPLEGEVVSLPNPAEASARDFQGALMRRLRAYTDAERTRLTIHDDTLDVWPEANTDEEIATMAWAISRTLEKLPKPELYYIRGESVFRVTVEDSPDPFAGSVKQIAPIADGEPFIAVFKHEYEEAEDRWRIVDIRPMRPFDAKIERVGPSAHPALAELAGRLPWNISHGVEPAAMALGANGCSDCHSTSSHFFFGDVVVDPFGADAMPVTVPQYERLGYSRGGLVMSAFRESVLKPYSHWLVLAVLLIIALHFTLIGSRDGAGKHAPDILRFNAFERYSHLALMVSVSYLCATGFCFLLGKRDPLGEWSRYFHLLFGYVAGVSFLAVTMLWLRQMLPAKGDGEWLRYMGGYLTGKGHYPAGKFNAGQKILFWKALVMMVVLVVTGLIMALNIDRRFPLQQVVYTLHDIAGMGMILLLIGHIYLAVFVNPHSVRSLFGGIVSSVWAKEHHPDWRPDA